jgi:5-methyltetrahydrofolate--homocysteine methyltransferase
VAELFEAITDGVIEGKLEDVKKLTQQALDSGSSPSDILDQGLLPGMDIVGQNFGEGLIFIPDVIRSAKTMSAAMDILRPLLTASGGTDRGTIVMGTVQGDLHSIGKNLVSMLLEGAGFKVVDLGINVQPQAFVAAVAQHRPKVLGMSALLTTTTPRMGETVRALQEAGIRDQVKVIVGGAPVSLEFAHTIGADAYASNASAAVETIKALAGVV